MDEGTAASSSATAADGAGVDVLEEASKLIGTGNKNLVMGDVPAAVNAFQEACGMLAQKYGDTADECAEAFFLCGKSLLELARVENGVLGNALEGVPEEEEEEEGVGEEQKKEDSKIESADNLDEKTRDELREQVYDAMAEKQGEGEDKTEKEKTEEKSESSEKAEEDKTITPTKEENKTKSPAKEGEGKTSPKKEKGKTPEEEEQEKEEAAMEEGKEAEDQSDKNSLPDKGDDSKEAEESKNRAGEDGEKGATEETAAEEAMQEGEDGEEGDEEEEGEGEATAEDEKESEEEEVGNLQLAWEMLEIAKVIYKRKESKEDQLFAAQAHLKLGEISVESGNYPQATEDFQECLAIQKKHLEPHSRLLAETHYQLGLVFSYINQYSKAIEHFNHSVEVIESRLAMLKEVIDKAKSDENVLEDKKEMEEIKLLLPDIREKIEDAKEGQKTCKEASAAILETLRKPEEESPTKDKDAKKAKPNTSVNGSGDTATNGSAVEDKKEASERSKT
ncbi:UNVERIFIED_CONTAM: hypothetical protein FKN15_038095 [Acipenser sinensis]